MYLTIYEIKNGGHWQSWGGHFLGVPSLRGHEGGTPPLFAIFFPPKVALLAYLKSQKVLGLSEPPIKEHFAISLISSPSGERVKLQTTLNSQFLNYASDYFAQHYLKFMASEFDLILSY